MKVLFSLALYPGSRWAATESLGTRLSSAVKFSMAI